MCFSSPSPPQPPAPIPMRQAAKAPDPGVTASRSDDVNRRRYAAAAAIFTPSSGLAPANTTGGKALLGQ